MELEIDKAVVKRHSVRQYQDREIEKDLADKLNEFIKAINLESGLSFELVLNEKTAFTGPLAHYGKFEHCYNYIIIKGPAKREEDVGYYGEKIVIYAQQIGLNTCWVALTYSKGKLNLRLEKGEKFYLLISIGYGRHRGLPRKSKPMEDLCRVNGEMPEWFKNGMDFAMRAPTAINQQRFMITLLENGEVEAKSFFGPCHKIDLGIVKYHFELGAKIPIKWKKV
ncbi:MAG: nitroreductase [Clostridia bacterium]|nr:nitroreductase [Clostridia bacterium]